MKGLRSWSVASRFCPQTIHQDWGTVLELEWRQNERWIPSRIIFFWGCLNVGGSLIRCQFPVWEPETSYLFMIFIEVLNSSTHLLVGWWRSTVYLFNNAAPSFCQTQITCFTWNWMGDTPPMQLRKLWEHLRAVHDVCIREQYLYPLVN